MNLQEDGRPKGVLSDFVSRELALRAQQKTTEESEQQAKLTQYLNASGPLRKYLAQLAAPIEALLERFKVRDILTEAGELINQKEEGKMFPQLYQVEELRPPFYAQVVSPSQPTESIQLAGATLELETLANPDNYRGLVPELDIYGVALSFTYKRNIHAKGRIQVWYPGHEIRRGNPVAGYSYESTSKAGYGWGEGQAFAPIQVDKSFSVEAVVAEQGPGYDLMYSHSLKRVDLRSNKYDDPQDRHIDLTPPQRIRRDDPLDTLAKLVSKDIVRELDGEHKDLLQGFMHQGTVENIRRGGGANLIYRSWASPFRPDLK